MRKFSTAFLSKYLTLLNQTGFEMILPKVITHQNMNLTSDYDTKALTNGISVPLYDMLERGGKAWRASLCLILSDIFKLDQQKMLPLAQIIDFIHNATLIHDDLEDKSQKRRGKPCTYLLYGIDRAVNVGAGSYFAPLMHLYTVPFDQATKDSLIKATIEELFVIHLGQATDIEWNNTDSIPTQAQYLRMITNKTSVLARLGARYPLIVSKANSELSEALITHTNNIGISFQITDDLINLQSEEYAKGRSYVGEDITEGKKSLIIIRTIQQNPEKASRLIEILKMKTSELALVNEALDIIKGTDAFEYCQKVGDEILKDSWRRIDKLIDNSEAKQDLHSLTFELLSRKS